MSNVCPILHIAKPVAISRKKLVNNLLTAVDRHQLLIECPPVRVRRQRKAVGWLGDKVIKADLVCGAHAMVKPLPAPAKQAEGEGCEKTRAKNPVGPGQIRTSSPSSD